MDPLALASTNQTLVKEPGAMLGQGGPCREKAQTIVDAMVKQHTRELAAWAYLAQAMNTLPPSAEEEAALWEVLCRARRERY